MANILAWLITSRGKKFMKIMTATVAVGTFSVQFFPNSIFLQQYRDLVAMRRDKLLYIDFRNGKPLTVAPELEKRYHKALDDIKLSEFHKNLLQPFMVFGYDTWHAGSLYSQFGALLGLPINFIYKKAEDIDKSGIIINDNHVNWNRKEAQNLLQSLILSDNAQKFAIAREIFMLDSQNTLLQSIISTIMVCFYYGLSSGFNNSWKMFDKPRSIRVCIYLLTGTFLWGIWAMQRDGLTRFYEYRADEKVSELSIDYIKGGVEYYNKIIQRNIALRALAGSSGERLFTLGGNEKVGFREKHIPNSNRKQFFEGKLKEYEEGKEVDVVMQNNTVAA